MGQTTWLSTRALVLHGDCTFKALLYQEHSPVICLPLGLGNKICWGVICHLQSPQPHLRPWSLPPAHPFEERYGNHRRSRSSTAVDSIAARPACGTEHRRCRRVSMSFYGRKMKIACPWSASEPSRDDRRKLAICCGFGSNSVERVPMRTAHLKRVQRSH